jgi:putative pyrroloquinoline-quinone binding quinoprotein
MTDRSTPDDPPQDDGPPAESTMDPDTTPADGTDVAEPDSAPADATADDSATDSATEDEPDDPGAEQPSSEPADPEPEPAGDGPAGSSGAAAATGPRAALATLLAGGRRRPVLAAVAAVVAVALAVTVIVVSTSGEPPVPSGEIPTLGNQFAPSSGDSPTTSPDPDEPASLPAYQGDPLWTFPLPDGTTDPDDGPQDIAVTDAGYVVQLDEKTVVGLDKAGTELWRYPATEDDLTVKANGPLVFVSYANPDADNWPQAQVVAALDPATGAERWRETEASFWSLTTDTVYLSVCTGEQNDHLGDCQLSARNPQTNSTRWRTAAYASSGVINTSDSAQAEPTPPYLLVESHPTGGADAVTSYDPDTGARLGTGFIGQDGDIDTLDSGGDRTVVEMNDHDENPADGCAATLTGYAVASAGQTWQYLSRTAKEDDGRKCGSMPYSINNGRIGVTTDAGVPAVLNAATGAVEWTAPTAGTALAASDTMLIAVETTEGTQAELVAYQVGNPTPIWRSPFAGTAGGARVTIGASSITVLSEDEAVGYDLASGDAWSYGSSIALETTGAFVLCGGGYCRAFPT